MKQQRNAVMARYPQAAKQQGIVAVVAAVGMVALLAAAGMALDAGHMLLSKTRLQNAVDAAALSAAKELMLSEDDIAAASADAIATFEANLNASDNAELLAAYNAGEMTLSVEFSQTLNPFTSAAVPPYVRVRAEGLRLDSFLLQVVGIAEKPVRASAVAGPVDLDNTVCDILPILACGCPEGDTSCDFKDHYGYSNPTDGVASSLDAIEIVKIAAGGTNDVGPGNFQLLRLGDDQGGADLRRALAGGTHRCATVGTTEDTEPGNSVGPVVQGLNVRFGINSGPDTGYKSDLVVKHGRKLVRDSATGKPAFDPNDSNSEEYFHHGKYKTKTKECRSSSPPADCELAGEPTRREMVFPIGDCSGTTNGQGEVPILGFGCFYLWQPVEQSGTEADVYGQFFGGCASPGTMSQNPVPGGPNRIVLFRDADSGDS